MVLSDRTIGRLIAAGRIGIEPYDPSLMQPSSLVVRVDNLFRVFRNSRYPYIDAEYAKGDRRHYDVPCPQCGRFQELVWARVTWEGGSRADPRCYLRETRWH